MLHNKIKPQNVPEEVTSEIDKNFLMAIRRRDYVECENLLKHGANINAKFGECSQDPRDACSFCGPNDTPLTHAVKEEDVNLTRFLLERNASTEVFNCGETPLMKAAFHHNVEIVALLLEFGAKVNAVDTRSGSSPMKFAFYGLKDWLLPEQKKSCNQVVSLLIAAGSVGTHNQIKSTLEGRGFGKNICNFFTESWKMYHTNLENFYTQGAVAGALNQRNLSTELSYHIGKFLNRDAGAKVAQTCRQAARISNTEMHKQMKAIYQSPLPLFQIAKINTLIRKYNLPDNTQTSLEKGLRNAASNNNINDLRFFLRVVKNINAQDANPKMRRTALHWASVKGHKECYQLLLNAGANLSVPDANGQIAHNIVQTPTVGIGM